MKNKSGFTLVELLAVIAILGIVVVLATRSIVSSLKDSKKQAFLTSVTSLVENIKPENYLYNKDFCMYNYDRDKKNQTELIKKMYVLAHKDGNNIIYSVYAKSYNDDVINIYDFSKIKKNENTWQPNNTYDSYLNEEMTKLLNAQEMDEYTTCGENGD